MQRENPPTHLIESIHGDFLRGRIESMDDNVVRISVRLETREIPRENVARIIWFGEEAKSEGDAAADGDEQPAELSPTMTVQALCNDGVRLTFTPSGLANDVLLGESPLLGACAVSLAEIDQLYLGDAIASAAEELAYSAWRLRPAADPKYLTEDGAPVDDIAGRESSLVGQPAPGFALEDLSGGTFRLSEQRGKVVVLDFWATWCGWCMQSMPELDALAAEFDGQIVWIAVNLQQDKKTIADALERLGVSPRVALDIDGAAAEKFSVTAIPQTVVVGADGVVARVFVGGGPDLVEQLREAIRETLDRPEED
jgi:thiol-disulfide isomerase/thioredoxin